MVEWRKKDGCLRLSGNRWKKCEKHDILHMGIYDWRGMNALQNQAVQVVRWLSATIMRVLQHVFKLEKQVCCILAFPI